MSLYNELDARGILKQVTSPKLKEAMDAGAITLYAGFDPTSDSLHVGSLLPLLTLKRFQQAGHKVIAVVGGATGMIGDPSFKAQERSLLTEEHLAKNLRGITGVAEKFLDLKGAAAARVMNNYDWIGPFSFVNFLRDIGKHFTINHMMAKESVRARLEDREHGISYTEFSYMLLQAYDFHHLHEKYGCRLQIGGSDQWGNITAGTELIRRMKAHAQGREATDQDEEHAFGLTHPLVMKADGTKFGKTESGTVWLSREKTSPYQFYQFWVQTQDVDIGTYLRYFSFKSLNEIAALEDTVKTSPEKRAAQQALAREMTELVHGKEALAAAEEATQILFGADPVTASAAAFQEIRGSIPHWVMPTAKLQSSMPLIEVLAESGLATSKGQARKDIEGGGICVNNQKVTDVALTLNVQHRLAGEYILLRKGKKNYLLVWVK
ncbi:MAG: tyrosine--tRNA ligase [Candidatus Obscuribacterales bacterium]|nr:tyrosine--tRNA ligase [Steroidobacteraceae bacterium]